MIKKIINKPDYIRASINFARFFFVGIAFIFSLQSVCAYVDSKSGTVESKKSFQIPELFKQGGVTQIDWNIERTSKFYGYTPAKVGGSVTVDSEGNVVSLNSDTSNGLYYLTSKGLEGTWAVGGAGDFGHILSYAELNDICINDKDFHSVADHKDWPDEGAHVMICTLYEKFKTIGCGFDCSHKNNYKYSFDYQIKKSDVWTPITDTNVNKCEDIKVIFTPTAEWFADLTHSCQEGESRNVVKERRIDLLSPATIFASCSDQDSCLNQAQEASLNTGIYAKGIEQVSANFVSLTENSLTGGADETLKCTSGNCVAYSSGKHTLSTKAPESKYFGQCRAEASSETVSGEKIDIPLVKISPPGVSVPETTSNLECNVINRAPLVSVSLSKNNPAVNEEVTATCDITDPDSCSDKIVKVKWTCFNENKQAVSCYFGKDGIWHEGTVSEYVPEASQSYQYRSIVQFKAGEGGVYALTCEGTDNDLASSMTGTGATTITVGGGEVAATMKFCSVLSEEGSTSKTVCGSTAKVNLKAYQFGIEPGKYEWKCKASDEFTSGTETKECPYDEGGTYVPGLRIFDNKSNTWVDCTSENNTVKVTDKSKCAVLVRPADSSDEYTAEAKINAGDQVEAKLETECLTQGDTKWESSGTKISESNSKTTLKFPTSGIGYVKASIGSTVCTPGSVNVSDNVQMGAQ